MKDYQRILVCTDFSDASMAAVDRGVDFVQRYGAKLNLLHVIEHFPEDMPNYAISPENRDPATFYFERAQKNLAELAQKIGQKDAGQEVIMSTGSARFEIRRFAEKEGVDLILVGAKGGGMLDVFGSTAMGVIYDPPCDVMVVRGT